MSRRASDSHLLLCPGLLPLQRHVHVINWAAKKQLWAVGLGRLLSDTTQETDYEESQQPCFLTAGWGRASRHSFPCFLLILMSFPMQKFKKQPKKKIP